MADADLRIDDAELTAALKAAADAARNLDPALKAIGLLMEASTREGMEMGGRPDKFAPWAASTAATYAKGRNAGAHRILVSPVARLLNSIVHKILFGLGSVAGIEWGSNLVYAAIQHFGGVAGRGYASELPPRPYINAPEGEDREDIILILQRHIMAPLVQG